MPKLRRYNLFICHPWDYNDQYETIFRWIKEAPFFNEANFSVSKFNPLPTKTNRELEEELEKKIKSVHLVIVIAGLYVNYRDWMIKEIEIATKNEIPIIGIKPRGNSKVPYLVQVKAKVILNWSSSSLIGAIRKWSR